MRSIFAALAVVVLVPMGAWAQEAGTPAWQGRVFVDIGAGIQTASHDFAYTQSTPLFGETASAGLNIPGRSGGTFDVGGGVRLVQNFGVGVVYSRYDKERTATLTTTVPSPFYYNESSTATQTLPLSRTEDAVHFQAIYRIPITAKFQVSGFGGPSYFRCRDDIVSDFGMLATVTMPDYGWNVSIQDIAKNVTKDSTWGYHLGGNAVYLVNKYFGLMGTARFSHAAHQTDNPFALPDVTGAGAVQTVTMRHGGMQWHGGVTFRF